MKYVIELLENKKEEHQGIVDHIQKLINKGSYRTNEEINGAEKLLLNSKNIINEINEAIDKIKS